MFKDHSCVYTPVKIKYVSKVFLLFILHIILYQKLFEISNNLCFEINPLQRGLRDMAHNIPEQKVQNQEYPSLL